MIQRTKILVIVLLLSIFSTSCKEETNNNQIPNVYVNFYFSLSDPEFASLNSIGNSVYVTGGVKGIIIHRVTFDEFTAFDRVSSYKPENFCVVKVDSVPYYAYDPCSMSKFSLIDGAPVRGPAISPLKKYNTQFDGNMSVHVFN